MSEKPCKDHSEDPNKRELQPDGGPPDCCAPPTPECNEPATCGPDCCAPPGSSHRTRWLLFLLVMAAAGVVLIYGIISREESAAQAPTANAVVDVGAPGLAEAAATDGDADSAGDATFSSGGSDAYVGGITQFASVIGMPDGSDVLFVLLPCDDKKRTLNARDVLNAAIEKIQEKGRAVAVRTLQRGQDGYAELVEQFAVSSFPCVIALGKDCGAEKVGEISESHLIRAFVIASQPPSGCKAGSACCPSPCGK